MRNNKLTTYSTPGSVWEFMSELEKNFNDLWSPESLATGSGKSISQFMPPIDLHETDDAFLVSIDVPGMSEKDVHIDVREGRLTVSGERKNESERKDGKFHRYEKSYGRFERSFQLPTNVNEDQIKAACDNGVLEVMIPKSEKSKPRSVQIEAKKGGLFSKLVGERNPQETEKH